MANLDPPLRPRSSNTLRVLIVARISTASQDPRSNDDQADLCRRWVADRYAGNVEWRTIVGQGSGERLDRRELFEAEQAVESGRLDLVIVEDLARICRRNRVLD